MCFMPVWFHHFAHLVFQVFVRWYTFLGTSPGGVIAQIAILLLTEVQGGWWKLETWRVNWRGGLKRAAYALGSVWIVVFLACTVATIYREHQSLAGRLRAVVNEKETLKTGLKERDDYIGRLESRPGSKTVIIKTTGSGRLDRDLNDQQSDHLYHKLKAYVDLPNRAREAKVVLVVAYPCDRESQHLFFRLSKVFTDAHWTVASEGGWPMKSVRLGGATQNQIPIGLWVLSDDQFLRYHIWNSLQESGLGADDSLSSAVLPENFKGLIVVIGYKDIPFLARR
jgi:hypothetical protein